MPSADYCEIDYFPAAADAQSARDILSASGVDVLFEGPVTNTFQSHIGGGLNGLTLYVRAEDAERALQVLGDWRTEYRGWFCHDCRVRVEVALDVCWSCGESRSFVESDTVDLPTSAIDLKLPASKLAADSNPYRASVEPGDVETREDPNAVDHEQDVRVLRAWNAATLSIVFPILMHTLAIRCLADIDIEGLSRPGRRRYWLSWLCLLVTSVGWIWMFLLMIGVRWS